MARLSTLLKTAGLGAGLMYFFDPDRGRQRRAWLEDKLKHMTNELIDGVDSTMRDLSNRIQGMTSEFSSAIEGSSRQGDRSRGNRSSQSQQRGDQSRQQQSGNPRQQGNSGSRQSSGSGNTAEEHSGENRPPVESKSTQSPGKERAESEAQWNEATTKK